MTTKTINYQFKLLYAIGIFFIVSGHLPFWGGVSLFYDWFPLYSFHLGLFCFASGYLYKNGDSIYKYIWKKIKRLIIPLYTWNFIYCLLVYCSSFWGFTIGVNPSISLIDKLFIMPLIDGHQFAYNLATWFIFPFFCVEVFNVLIRSIIKFRYKDIIIFFIGLILGLFAIAYSNLVGEKHGIELLLIRTLSFLPFFCFGTLYKSTLESKDTISNKWYFLIILVIDLILMIFHGSEFVGLSQAWGRYNLNPFIVFSVGALGIAFWLRITRILTPFLGKNKIVNTIADNTFYIMTHHFIGFMLLKSFLGVLSIYTPLMPIFDKAQFLSDIWYFYSPNNLGQFSIIYVVFGIYIPIVIRKIIPKNIGLG